VFATRPIATSRSLPSICRSPFAVRSVTVISSPEHDLDALGGQDIQHLFRHIGILAGHELATRFDDRHATAEAAVGLRHFDPDIASAQHDQVRRQVIEFQCFDVRECAGGFETRNIRDRSVRADIEDHLIAGEQARAAVVQGDLDGLWAGKATAAHDQFGAAALVGTEVECDLAIDHVLLAAAHLAHVDLDTRRQRTELRGVLYQMGDPRAPEFVLGRQAGNGGTRAADPAALHDGNLFAGMAQMPCKLLSALAAAEDYDIEVFGLRHDDTNPSV
jgi:hypothetical protein